MLLHNYRKLDISGSDSKGMTALHFACKNNMKANVKILLDNGAGEYNNHSYWHIILYTHNTQITL